MLKHTKIVATVSDQRCDVAFVEALYKAGMNVVRLNTAHMMEEGLTRVVNNVRTVSDRIGILMDTKGPEVRTTTTVNKEPIPFKTGEIVKVIGNPDQETSHDCICVSYKNFVNDLAIGSDILIDDGDLEMKVTGKSGDCLLCEIQNDATLGSRKSVNVPGVRINLPSLTEKDRNNILWAIDHDLDFIAHSFVRNKQDVLDIQRILDERNSPIKIIAKIENQEGVDNIEEILEVAYGVMIARGDLGIEVPAEKIPGIQRMLIRKCVEVKKPVIVATQMLHSMINNPRPTRAEATDVANAIYDGTSATMLSGETAAGAYPVEAVKMMARIAERTEKEINYRKRFNDMAKYTDPGITDAICHATCSTAYDLDAKAIITVTKSGFSARMISKYRPDCTIIGECLTEKVCRQLNLEWGVEPILITEEQDASQLFEKAVDVAETAGFVSKGELVVLTGGVPLGVSGTTNLIKVQVAGHILVTGKGLNGKKISGNLCVCHSNEDLKSFKDGDIIVAADTTNEMMAQMRQASALIVEAEGANCHAAIAGLSLDIPVLIAAKNALDVLKTSAYVEVDCESGVVSAN